MLSLRDPIRMLLEKKGKCTLISESNTQMYNNLLDEEDEGTAQTVDINH